MRILILLYISFAFCLPKLTAQSWPVSLAGRWTFDNPGNLLQAHTGNNLALHGNHQVVTGPSSTDGAASIDTGSYYVCTHGMQGNGSGYKVNEYTILADIFIPDPKVWHCLYQTSPLNNDDGELFTNTFSQFGLSYTGYSGFSLKPGTWYRLVVAVDLGNNFRFYLDGKLFHQAASVASDIDGRFSLDSLVLFFADENLEDNMVHVAQLALFSAALTANQVKDLGGFRPSNIFPFLQSPSPSSVYVSWNAFQNSTSVVQYGTSSQMGSMKSGGFQDIGTTGNIIRWHSVKLTSLMPDTRYYYRCISGTDTSETFTFRTPPVASASGKHIRFVKVGDSQTEVLTSTAIADTILYKLQQLYGNQWNDSVAFIMHTGDIMHLGSDPGRYANEFFNPYSRLTPFVPLMISIGNHEVESDYYYQYMQYSDLGGNNERYYRFSLGRCLFIALNTNTTWQVQAQLDWLKSEMDKAEIDSTIDFVFCYFHHPGYSEVWPASNTPWVESQVFQTLGGYSKLVMNTFGHSHNYERQVLPGTHQGQWDAWNIICGGAGGILDRWGMYTGQVDLKEVKVALDHYGFLIVDIDQDAMKVEATFYSLGHPDKPRNLEKADFWHRSLLQPPPPKPQAVAPAGFAFDNPVLTGSPYVGPDSLMTVHFQLTDTTDDFSTPLLEVFQDEQNVFWDSGTPLWNPVDLNAGIVPRQYQIQSGLLKADSVYQWRVRYRDYNLRWSDWSDSARFQVQTIGMPSSEKTFFISAQPNPFHENTTFELFTDGGPVSASILSSNGTSVRNLFSGYLSPGNTSLRWDGTDEQGTPVTAGIYFCRLVYKHQTVIVRLVHL